MSAGWGRGEAGVGKRSCGEVHPISALLHTDPLWRGAGSDQLLMAALHHAARQSGQRMLIYIQEL